MKTCSKCKTEKDNKHYRIRKDKRMGPTYRCLESICIECKNTLRREWYVRNRERQIQAAKEYVTRNPEKKRAWDKKYRQKHAQELSVRKKSHYLNNKASIRDKQKEYYLLNSETIKNKVKEWVQKNPDKVRANKKKWALENQGAINILSILKTLLSPEKRKVVANKSARKASKELKDSYIKQTLRAQKVPKEAWSSQELLDLKRELIKIQRKLKK